jgi:hypothetical protein
MILFSEASLQHVLSNYAQHYHAERNHQGKGNVILFPAAADRIGESTGEIRTRQRLGGLLKFYGRLAQILLPRGCMNFLPLRGRH